MFRVLISWIVYPMVFVAFYRSFAQTSNIGAIRQQTLSQALLNKGVKSDIASLQDALRNNDPAIRGLAALRLSELKSSESVTSMQQALSSESDDEAYVEIAAALLRFDASQTESDLNQFCSRPNVHAKQLIEATEALRSNSGAYPAACVSALVRTLEVPDDPTYAAHANALEILAQIQNLSPTAVRRANEAGLRLLKDKEPSVRLSAARLINKMPINQNMEALLEASAREEDPAVKASLDKIVATHRSNQGPIE